MSFYPLFNVVGNSGFVNLPNFSPNNWEKTQEGSKEIYAISTDGTMWRSEYYMSIQPNRFALVHANNFRSNEVIEHEGTYLSDLRLLQLKETKGFEGEFSELPKNTLGSTHFPEWRATIGLENSSSKVSYQGEINPVPSHASLLTFHPFIQFGDVENYFVFLNLEKSPIYRWAEIEIYLAGTAKKVGTHKIRNNSANIIPLNQYGFSPSDLPVFLSKNMAGIPFGFGMDIKSGMLSLEHTHPPASFTLHGNRLSSQKSIKTNWSNFLNKK
jgi:hypothetical protein